MSNNSTFSIKLFPLEMIKFSILPTATSSDTTRAISLFIAGNLGTCLYSLSLVLIPDIISKSKVNK